MIDLSSPNSDNSGVVQIRLIYLLANQDIHPCELPISSNVPHIFSLAVLSPAMSFGAQSSLYNVAVPFSFLGRLSNLPMYVLFALTSSVMLPNISDNFQDFTFLPEYAVWTPVLTSSKNLEKSKASLCKTLAPISSKILTSK